jgi:hypothetical protein
VVFAQDFLRGDYARIHTDAQLEQRDSAVAGDATGKEGLAESIS